MDDFYRDQLLDHYQHPRNFRVLDDATHQAHANNPLCGDDIDIFLHISNNQIQDISFQAQSCAVTMATASLLTEQLKGKPVSDATDFQLANALELLGTPLTATRQQCAQVVITALHTALAARYTPST